MSMIEDIEQYASFISYLEDKIHDKKIELKTLEEALDAAKCGMKKAIGVQ